MCRKLLGISSIPAVLICLSSKQSLFGKVLAKSRSVEKQEVQHSGLRCERLEI